MHGADIGLGAHDQRVSSVLILFPKSNLFILNGRYIPRIQIYSITIFQFQRDIFDVFVWLGTCKHYLCMQIAHNLKVSLHRCGNLETRIHLAILPQCFPCHDVIHFTIHQFVSFLLDCSSEFTMSFDLLDTDNPES